MPRDATESHKSPAQRPSDVEESGPASWLWSPAAGYAAILAAAAIWGFYWAAIKPVMRHISPMSLNWLQMVPVWFITAAVHLAARRHEQEREYPVFWLAVFGLIASMIFYTRNLGCQLTSPTTGAILTRLDVLFAAILSALVLKVPLTTTAASGGILLLFGAALVMNVFSKGLVFNALGYAVLVLCGFGVAVNALIIKLFFNRTPPEVTSFASATVQCIVFPPLLVATGQWQETIRAAMTPELRVQVFGLSLLIAAGLYLYYFAMKRAPMTNIRLIYLTTPAFAMLADHFWLGAAITPAQLAGLVAVMVGAALVIRGTPSDLMARERAGIKKAVG